MKGSGRHESFRSPVETKGGVVHMARPTWDEHFIDMAKLVSMRSSCLKRQVGAVAVSKDHRVLATGYNGTPTGMANCDEGGCVRCADTKTPSGVGLDQCMCLHAEQNVILQASIYGISLTGAVMYCTNRPCLTCAKLLLGTGIPWVIFAKEYPMDEKLLDVLKYAGLTMRMYKVP